MIDLRRESVRSSFIMLLSVVCTTLLVVSPARAEKIRLLSSDATLTESGRLLVHEVIDIDLAGAVRHGLSRTIPTKVEEQGINHKFFVKVHNVSSKNGHRIPYTVKEHGDVVTIRIDTAHSGNSNFEFAIDYEVRGVCNFAKQHPQLYFPFTGHEWPFVVEKTQVILRPPGKIHLNESELKAWEGPPGSNRSASVKLVGDHILATASELPPGSGLTFEVDFPRGTIPAAGFIDHFEWLVDDWYLLIALPLLAVAILSCYRLMRAKRASKIVDAEENWKPPHDLTPVELGTLIDGSCDVQDLTGILLDLSIRGYYTIREIPATGFFNLSDRDYEFKKHAYPTTDKLHDYETLFLEALFGNATTSYLSNVQGGFRQFVPKIKDSIYANLISSGFLLKNPEKDKKRFYAIGFSMCCVGIALLFLYGEETIAKAAGLGFVVAGALVAVALQFFPLLTENGKDTIDRAHEFAELMRTAEAHNMAEKIAKDPFLFHRLLPYSMVLGVSEKWAAACEQHIEMWPDWFQFHRGSQQSGPFITTDFARDVWIATRIAGLTFFAPPPVQYSSYAVGKMGTRKEQEHDS